VALSPITPGGVSTALVYPVLTSAGPGYRTVLNAGPGDVNAPIIFEPPSALAGGQLVVWIIATGASSNWGGCQVFASLDADGTGNYAQIGTILAGGVQGALTADFPSGSDPDTTDTLAVDLTQSFASLTAGMQSDADDFTTLCYVASASGYELVAYSAATLTASYQYDLGTYIRRGVYGTTIADHPAGSAFARIVGTTFRQAYPANLVGSTLWLKFLSFNSLGAQLQALSDVDPYSYTLTGGAAQGANWFQSFSVGGKFSDMVADEFDGNYEIFDVQMPVAVTFQTNFSPSPTPGCETAPGSDVTLTFQTIHAGTATTAGTLSIANGQTAGSFSLSGPITVPAGDRLRLYAPSGVDTTITGLFGTLAGTR
jgi:hypothetical protein